MLKALLPIAFVLALTAPALAEGVDYAADVNIVEACSCPMFCQCFFNTEPAGHASMGDMDMGGHYCKANNAYMISKGHYGKVDLAGAKFWFAGDLGNDFSDMQGKWAHVIFDKATTPAQRAGIGAVMMHIYPMTWEVPMTFGEGNIDWHSSDTEAYATINGGKDGEVRLAPSANQTGGPIVLTHLKYFNEDSNDGFHLMPNTVEAWRGQGGVETYEFKGTNGFTITLHVDGNTAADAAMMAEMHADDGAVDAAADNGDHMPGM
ncbi:MAG: DUF1326 domain-containing protein [bacterium]